MPPPGIIIKAPLPSSRYLCLRTFTTTTSPRLKIIPESPKFVAIPRPPPVKPTWKPYIKGKLPAPRTIFRAKNLGKASAENLALMTPQPTRTKRIPRNQPEVKAFIEWKAKMAESRRRNLREGLTELHHKKEEFDKKRAEISALRNKEREELLARKQREDVRLTLPSVLSTLRHNGPIRDPNREERIGRKEAIREAKEKVKVAKRGEQVHELYLHASSFILTEKALDAAIESEFTEQDWQKTTLKVFPYTVSEMLIKRAEGPSVSNITTFNAKDSELMLDVGGALTGGRLPGGSLQKLHLVKGEKFFGPRAS